MILEGSNIGIHRLTQFFIWLFNPLNAELNPIRHLLALVGAHHIAHVSRVRVNIYCMFRPLCISNHRIH